MTPEERDRLTRAESDTKNVRDDVREIKQFLMTMDGRMAKMEKVAASGNGAFHMILIIGGFIGWIAALSISIASMFRMH